MTVRKKSEGNDIFEDIVKQDDKIVQFTLVGIDDQTASWQKRIDAIQVEIDKLNARKAAALAL